MNLETATEEILYNTILWIEGNRNSRPGWMIANFPNMFLSNCKLLVTTEEFKDWRNIDFLRPRYLAFDMDAFGNLKTLQFNCPKMIYKDAAIERLNRFLREILVIYRETGWIGERFVTDLDEPMAPGKDTNSKTGKTSSFSSDIQKSPISLNISSIENFKF